MEGLPTSQDHPLVPVNPPFRVTLARFPPAGFGAGGKSLVRPSSARGISPGRHRAAVSPLAPSIGRRCCTYFFSGWTSIPARAERKKEMGGPPNRWGLGHLRRSSYAAPIFAVMPPAEESKFPPVGERTHSRDRKEISAAAWPRKVDCAGWMLSEDGARLGRTLGDYLRRMYLVERSLSF